MDKGAGGFSDSTGSRRPVTLARAREKEALGVLQLLLAKGADVNATGRSRQTALSDCATVEALDLLVEAGASCSVADYHGGTPLHKAAARVDPALAERLLAHGADPNAKDRHGSTPLDVARSRRRTAVVALLESHGARSGKGDDSGPTAQGQ